MKPITYQIEEIYGEICDNYCKYSEMFTSEITDEEYDKITKEHCEKCPLNKLY